MIGRQLNILDSKSFFLFGARGVGKTHFLKHSFIKSRKQIWIDLLEYNEEMRFSENPDILSELIEHQKPEWVVIDEVQKIPKLLDIVHKEIEARKIKFALTGSSARKLKRGGANLLAGRAFVYHMFPFTHLELSREFRLKEVLRWGSLPGLIELKTEREKTLFLKNYVETYLKEEVFAEQLARNIIPFRKFLKLASQTNGTIINFSNISNDIGIDDKTVKNYFDILEDTLLGFYLPANETSFRKQQIKSPKFYLFDCGVKRAIDGVQGYEIQSSQELGVLFEHFIITEIHRMNSYQDSPYELSYLMTKAGSEIDLILEKPRGEKIFIEIKSSKLIRDSHLRTLKSFKNEYPDNRYICISQESSPRIHDGVEVLPWKMVFKELGL